MEAGFKKRRGGTIVEATMVFPIVILAVVALVYVMVSLYSAVCAQAYLHLALREASTELSETTVSYQSAESYNPGDRFGRVAFFEAVTPDEDKSIGIGKISAEFTREYNGGALIDHGVSRRHEARCYVIDEENYIRKLDLIL